MDSLNIKERCTFLFILLSLPYYSCSLSGPMKRKDIDISLNRQSLDIVRKNINETDNRQVIQQINDTMSSSYTDQQSKDKDIDSDASVVFHAILNFEKLFIQDITNVLTPIHHNELRNAHGIQSPTFRNCSNDINFVIKAATDRHRWALEMIDACGKSGSGILRDELHFIGDYDECMDVDTGHDFEGRYCTTDIWISKVQATHLSKPTKITMGLCFPSSCDATEVENVVNEYVQSLTDITGYAEETQCQKRHLKLTTTAGVVIYICSIFATILIAATVYDVFYKRMWLEDTRNRYRKSGKNGNACGNDCSNMDKKNSEAEPITDLDARTGKFYSQGMAASQTKSTKSEMCDQLLMSFSVFTNASKLFSVTQSQESIDCIHGIRFITMTWIILLHLYTLGGKTWGNAKVFVTESIERCTFMTVLNAQFAVDTFFALSGLLMSYLNLKAFSKDRVTFKFFSTLYFHRFLRLTPAYLLVLMTYVPLMRYISDGPIWPQKGFDTDQCMDTWWANLLYLSNLVKAENVCMGWSWYLSCDIQFFIVSPLLLLPLLYYKWKGLLVAFTFLLGTAICSGVITIVDDLESVGSFAKFVLYGELTDYYDHYYVKPYTRIGPFIVGIVTGFLLFKSEMKAQIPKFVAALGWIAATATALAIVYGPCDQVTCNEQPSIGVRVMYNSLSRIAWGISVCWVIFACANGYGGFVNTLLSWKALVPLSRLTYCVYLTHPLVIQIHTFSQRKPLHRDNINIAFDMCGVTVVSYAVAFLFSMAYEAPMVGLEKAIRNQRKKKRN